MAAEARPFRRGIWDVNPRYHIPYSSLSESDLQTIFRLMSVDAAKKRIPPVAGMDLLTIGKLARALPRASKARITDIEKYLEGGCACLGAGIITSICMLAVETSGDYPPMDQKFAAGLKAHRRISTGERDALVGKSESKFAKVYVEKVIPVWRESKRSQSAKSADHFWSMAGQQRTRR